MRAGKRGEGDLNLLSKYSNQREERENLTKQLQEGAIPYTKEIAKKQLKRIDNLKASFEKANKISKFLAIKGKRSKKEVTKAIY